MDVLPSGVVIPQYCSIDDVEGHRFCTFQIFKVSELRFQHRTVTFNSSKTLPCSSPLPVCLRDYYKHYKTSYEQFRQLSYKKVVSFAIEGWGW